MNAETVFQAVQAVAVVAGVGFAVYETRRYRNERNREAAMQLLHAFQTPEFAKALVLVYRVPDALATQRIESSPGEALPLRISRRLSGSFIDVPAVWLNSESRAALAGIPTSCMRWRPLGKASGSWSA